MSINMFRNLFIESFRSTFRSQWVLLFHFIFHISFFSMKKKSWMKAEFISLPSFVSMIIGDRRNDHHAGFTKPDPDWEVFQITAKL